MPTVLPTVTTIFMTAVFWYIFFEFFNCSDALWCPSTEEVPTMLEFVCGGAELNSLLRCVVMTPDENRKDARTTQSIGNRTVCARFDRKLAALRTWNCGCSCHGTFLLERRS